MPQMPIARPPRLSSFATSDLLILPASTIWTISLVSSSVTRRPLTNSVSLPTRLSILEISGPPPCTSTILTPMRLISTMSRMTSCLSSSLIMALPPYLTTTILPLYFWI